MKLHGAAEVLDRQTGEPLGSDVTRDVAEYIAFRYGRYSHERHAQRRRAYQRAEAVRERNRGRDAGILRDRVAGMTGRALADKYGVTERTVWRVIRAADCNSGKCHDARRLRRVGEGAGDNRLTAPTLEHRRWPPDSLGRWVREGASLP